MTPLLEDAEEKRGAVQFVATLPMHRMPRQWPCGGANGRAEEDRGKVEGGGIKRDVSLKPVRRDLLECMEAQDETTNFLSSSLCYLYRRWYVQRLAMV
jgi:hypothetical protein